MQHAFAKIRFNQQGTPVAEDFDDVYFSNENGLAESQYVFLQQNQLLDRWSSWCCDSFVIAETGFGSGLNFLAATESFIRWSAGSTGAQCKSSVLSKLHFISTEKYPMRKQDADKTLARFSDLTLTRALIAQWPLNLQGCHRLNFSVNVTDQKQVSITLDLWIGDIVDSLPEIDCNEEGLVDAWFLDGFAPRKNPEMWQPSLFDHIFRLSKVNTTFSTFTAAGVVKRGLTDAGFDVEKRKGFGKKRDMLAGVLRSKTSPREYQSKSISNRQPFYRRLSGSRSRKTIASVIIAGGGVAAANVCYALAKRGVSSTLIVKDDTLAQGASGNPQAGFYPQLNAEPSVASRIQLHSFLFARRLYDELLTHGHHFDHQWCGTLLVAFSEEVQKRQHNLINKGYWPEQVLQSVTPEKSAALAGLSLPYSGLFIPAGGWLSPPGLVHALVRAAQRLVDIKIHLSVEVTEHTSAQTGVSVKLSNDTQLNADALIVATGHQLNQLNGFEQIPTALTRGQVESIPIQSPLSELKTVLCHKGYLTPSHPDQHHALGSTYVKGDENTDYRKTEETQNLSMHSRSLRECGWAQAISGQAMGRASVRCSTPDHLPLVGALPDLPNQQKQYANYGGKRPQQLPQIPQDIDNVYMLSGLGSRGLTTAPLAAELLVSQLLAEPLPMEHSLLAHLNPNRFMIRRIKSTLGK